MKKTLKDLALALLNATLILVVICLVLAWKITDKADQITAIFAQNLITIAPLREDIQGLTDEMTALRTDLAQLPTQSDVQRSATLRQVQTKMEQIEAQMNAARQSITELSKAPTQLIDYAIDASADRLTQSINDLRSCSPPAS